MPASAQCLGSTPHPAAQMGRVIRIWQASPPRHRKPAAPSSGRTRDRVVPIHHAVGGLGPPCRQPIILSLCPNGCSGVMWLYATCWIQQGAWWSPTASAAREVDPKEETTSASKPKRGDAIRGARTIPTPKKRTRGWRPLQGTGYRPHVAHVGPLCRGPSSIWSKSRAIARPYSLQATHAPTPPPLHSPGSGWGSVPS